MKSLALFFILFLTASVAAQETCPLAESPSLLGLRPGMSPEEAQSVFGNNLKIKVKKQGERVIFQNYIKESPPPQLSGVRALYLRFFDRKLYQIEVFYQESPAIKTLKDFTDSLSAKWNFPASAWQFREIKAVVDCGNFSLTALKVLNPRIELTDETARAKVEAARNKKK